VFMEVEAMCNIVDDPRELGNCRMLFPKTELFVWYEMQLVD